MPDLSLATETDTAPVLGPSVAQGVLPTAVDASLPTAVEWDGEVVPFTPVVVPGTYPGEDVYPGDDLFPNDATTITAPVTAIAPLPRADEADTALTARPLAIKAVIAAAEFDLAIPLTELVDNATFGEAIDDVDRIPVYVVKADWNRNGLYDHPLSDLTNLVEEVTVDRERSGELPVEVGQVEGYFTAHLTVKLAGTWDYDAPVIDYKATRINLAPNPSFELTVTDYYTVHGGEMLAPVLVGQGNAIAGYSGQYYLYARPGEDDGSDAVYVRCPLVAVTPGGTYTFSAYRQVFGTVATTRVGVDWMDADRNQIDGTVLGDPILNSGWDRGHLTAVAPPGAAYARQWLYGDTVDYNNYVRWDAILAEPGDSLGAYFDGDTTGARWSGPAHSSSSTMIVTTSSGTARHTLDSVDVFAPYRSDSPLYGLPLIQTPIYLETGMITETGSRLTRRFTGTVTQIHPASLDRSVQLTAIDPTHRLRESITLPAVAMSENLMRRLGPDVYRSRIDSQWLIDHILRRNGIYASPPPRPDAVLSVTGHGSMIPEVGWGGSPEEYYPTFRGEVWQYGPFGMLAPVNGHRGRWWLNEPVTAAPLTGVGLSMWLLMDPAPGESLEYLRIAVAEDNGVYLTFGIDDDGRPYFGLLRPGIAEQRSVPLGWLPPSVSAWKFLGLHAAFTQNTMTLRWRLDSQLYTQTVTIPARGVTYRPDVTVIYQWWRPFTNLQMWSSPYAPLSGPWQGEAWEPQADIDPGANAFTGIPQIFGEDSWELLKEICTAEGSTFEWTEEGRPQFRTRVGDFDRAIPPVVTETITAERNLADLVATTDEASVRNTINIKTKALLVSDWQDYYTSPANDAFDCPPNSVNYFEINMTSAAYEIPPPLSGKGSIDRPGMWDYLGGDGFIQYSTNENWQASQRQAATKDYVRAMIINADNPIDWVDVGVQIRVTRTSPWRMQVMITNTNAFPIRFATLTEVDAETDVVTDGEPAFVIPATMIEEGEEQLETHTDNHSVAVYGPLSFEIASGTDRWRQTPEKFRGLAQSMLATTTRPVPVLDAVDVPHDPRRRLRQRVELADPDGLGSTLGTIAGLSTTYTDTGASDVVTVRPLAPPGLGLLDDPNLGVLNSSLVLG